jgi:protein gp37
MNIENVRKIMQSCNDKDLKRIFKDLSERTQDAWGQTVLSTVVEEMAVRELI